MPIPFWSYVKGKALKEGVRYAAKAFGADDQTAKTLGIVVGTGTGVIVGIVTLDLLGVGAALAGEIAEETLEEAAEQIAENLAEEAVEGAVSDISTGTADQMVQHFVSSNITFGQATEALLSANSVADLSFSTISAQISSIMSSLPIDARNILTRGIESGDFTTLHSALDNAIQTIPSNNTATIRKVGKILQAAIKFKGG